MFSPGLVSFIQSTQSHHLWSNVFYLSPLSWTFHPFGNGKATCWAMYFSFQLHKPLSLLTPIVDSISPCDLLQLPTSTWMSSASSSYFHIIRKRETTPSCELLSVLHQSGLWSCSTLSSDQLFKQLEILVELEWLREFPSRPGGSIQSAATWTFSIQSPTSCHLLSDVFLLSPLSRTLHPFKNSAPHV